MPLVLCLLALAAIAQPLPRLAHAGFTLTLEEGDLRVVQVRANGPAAKSGIQPGDRIGTDTPTPDFARSLLRRPDGHSLPLTLRRNSQVFSVTLQYLAPPRESQPDFDVEYAAVPVDGHRRRTIMTVPRGRRNPPVVLWLPGSGCATLESPDAASPETQLLYAFTRAGFKTVRVEKSGIGDSEGPPCYSAEATLALDVRAYAAAIAQLRPARIFLFGHSAGATLAPLVLQAAGKVDGVILAGGMGTDFRNYVLDMRRRELERTNQNGAAEMAIHTRCLDALLLQNQSPDEIEAAMPDCRRHVRFDSHPAYIADWAKLDLAREWRAAPSVPVLVLHGEADQVTSQMQSETLARHIPRADLQILPIDHDFRNAATPGQPYERAIRASLQFLKKRR